MVPEPSLCPVAKIYHERPDGKGGMAPCDTWDNAMLHTEATINGIETPMRFEMKRLAPGATNTWSIEILGTDGGMRYSTAEPKTLWKFDRSKEQWWSRTDLGFQTPFPTITGASSSPASRTVFCRCGLPSRLNTLGPSATALVVSPRTKQSEATNSSKPHWLLMPNARL